MAQSVIEALLSSKIGLNINSIGSQAIASAIQQRMADCRITCISSYLQHLQDSPLEWDAFIDQVIVPETWFFREPKSFKFLQHYVTSQWLPNKPQQPLRVLSIPCATGEEPYSIAIALLEVGLSASQIHIDAVDISKRCLVKAQQAIYDRYSFRGNSLSFQEQYFQPTNSGYRLREQIRGMVNFINGNLADPHFFVGRPLYDVIFCRNLLIYFDFSTKEQTLQVLKRLLVDQGLLFVAHVETGLLMKTQLIPVRHHSTIAYQKATSHQIFVEKTPSVPSSHFHKPAIIQQQPIITQQLQTDLFTKAQISADQGRLNEAAQLCQDYLGQNPVQAEAYVLLGEVQQAMGEIEAAAQSFHKAIYLQPDHQAALTHLALLRENQGDDTSAKRLWQRIDRLNHRETKGKFH